MKTWLLTWEGQGVTDAQKLVGMYHFRRSDPFIIELIEFLYLCHYANASQMTWLANRQSQRPYKAYNVRPYGVPMRGMLACGGSPWIYARLVSELDCTTDDKRDVEILTWREPPLWEWEDRAAAKIRKVNEGADGRLERPARAIRRTVFES